MRCALVIVLLAALSGCGQTAPERPKSPVRLTLAAPSDLDEVFGEVVEVSGSVVPASARVRVAGDETEVVAGDFSASVALDAGVNVIDVQAGAPGRAAAMTAVRVERVVLVEIPQLAGASPEEAEKQLEALELEVEFNYTGDLLDEVLFGDDGVCGTDPGEGEMVRPGTLVVVELQGACGG